MGFSPRQLDAMTQWEFTAALATWSKANRVEDEQAPAMSDDRLAELGIDGFQ